MSSDTKNESKEEKKGPYVVSKIVITTNTKDDGNTKWFRICLDNNPTRYFINKDTLKIKNILNGKYIKSYNYNGRGYQAVYLTYSMKKYQVMYHRIICAIFIPIPEEFKKLGLKQIHLMPNHKDGDPTNNTLDNLEWATPKTNTVHAFETGLAHASMGEDSYLAKITEKQAIRICELLQEGKSFKEVADEVGCSKKTVIHIKAGECWKHISKNYNFPKNDAKKPNSIPVETIHEICKMIETKKYSDREIAEKFDTKREYVRDIRNHKRRNDISKNYNF